MALLECAVQQDLSERLEVLLMDSGSLCAIPVLAAGQGVLQHGHCV